MSFEEYKAYPLQKKKAIARFCLEVAASDGKVDEDELNTIAAILYNAFELEITSDLVEELMSDFDYMEVLKAFDEGELNTLGVILSLVAKADGTFSFSEMDHIKELLIAGGMNVSYVSVLLEVLSQAQETDEE